jgi:transcriptional regulator with XRE-family HTH domain
VKNKSAPDARGSFGRKVRALRERLGISQEELAYRAGLHRTYVGDVERGERNISLLNIVQIAAALEVPPSELLQDLPTQKVVPAGSIQGKKRA